MCTPAINGQHRHCITALYRHYIAAIPHWLIPSVPSDFTRHYRHYRHYTSNRRYRGTATVLLLCALRKGLITSHSSCSCSAYNNQDERVNPSIYWYTGSTWKKNEIHLESQTNSSEIRLAHLVQLPRHDRLVPGAAVEVASAHGKASHVSRVAH